MHYYCRTHDRFHFSDRCPLCHPRDTIIQCSKCERFKGYWNFEKAMRYRDNPTCLNCQEKNRQSHAIIKLRRLISISMKNKLPDLRNHLFECIELVKSKEMKPEEAKTVCELAQAIINSAKVELEFMKVVGIKESDFMQIGYTSDSKELPHVDIKVK